jgi:hypothetical protein
MEYYHLVRVFRREVMGIKRLPGRFWELSTSIEHPKANLVAVDITQGTLIHEDHEYEVMELVLDEEPPLPVSRLLARRNKVIRTQSHTILRGHSMGV